MVGSGNPDFKYAKFAQMISVNVIARALLLVRRIKNPNSAKAKALLQGTLDPKCPYSARSWALLLVCQLYINFKIQYRQHGYLACYLTLDQNPRKVLELAVTSILDLKFP